MNPRPKWATQLLKTILGKSTGETVIVRCRSYREVSRVFSRAGWTKGDYSMRRLDGGLINNDTNAIVTDFEVTRK